MTLRTRSSWILFVVCVAALPLAVASAQIGAAQESPRNLVIHNAPKPVAPIKFEDEGGQTRSLADFNGKVVVLNIWATWCVPCRREMPTLDRLQAALGGPEFEVIPVSIDRGGIDTIRKFYADIAVHNLAMYVDTSGQALREIGAIGLPTTLIVNRDGEEVGRIVGPAEWDSAEIMQFLRLIIAKQRTTPLTASSQTDPAHVAEIAGTKRDAPRRVAARAPMAQSAIRQITCGGHMAASEATKTGDTSQSMERTQRRQKSLSATVDLTLQPNDGSLQQNDEYREQVEG
jgi:thiol-disulfide isomerase/thioredoxin